MVDQLFEMGSSVRTVYSMAAPMVPGNQAASLAETIPEILIFKKIFTNGKFWAKNSNSLSCKINIIVSNGLLFFLRIPGHNFADYSKQFIFWSIRYFLSSKWQNVENIYFYFV